MDGKCQYCDGSAPGDDTCDTCRDVIRLFPGVGPNLLRTMRLSSELVNAYSKDKKLLTLCKGILEMAVELSKEKWGITQTPMLDTIHPAAHLWMRQVEETIELLKKAGY